MRTLAALLLLSLALAAQDRVDIYGDPLPAGVVGRLGTARLRHRGGVLAMEFSADGLSLTTAGIDGDLVRVERWEVATGKSVARCAPWAPGADGLALAPGGDLVAIARGGSEVSVIQVATGGALSESQAAPTSVTAMAFSADGARVAIGTAEGKVRIHDPAHPDAAWLPAPVKRGIAWLAFGADGGSLFIADGGRGPLSRCDLASGAWAPLLAGDGAWERPCALSRDGAWIATCGSPGPVRLWDARTGALARTLGARSGGFASVSFSRGGRVLAACKPEGDVCAWECATGRVLLRASSRIRPTLVAVDDAGTRLAAATALAGGAIETWDLATGDRPRSRGHEGKVAQIAFTPDGEGIVSAAEDGSVRTWETASGRLLERYDVRPGATPRFALSGDGRVVAIGAKDGLSLIRLFYPATGRSPRELHGSRPPRLLLGFVGNDRLCYMDREGGGFLWDLIQGRPVSEYRFGWGLNQRPFASSLSGRKFAWSIGINGSFVMDCDSAVHRSLGHPDPLGFVFLGDDRLVAWSGFREREGLHVYNLEAEPGHGEGMIDLLTRDDDVDGEFAATRDGAYLAFANRDRTRVRVFDVEAREFVSEAPGDGRRVTALALSPDGRTLATGGLDGCVLVWDVAAPISEGGDLGELWEALAAGGRAAWTAARRLAARGDEAAEELDRRLLPPPGGEGRVAELLVRLDADDVAVREAAQRELIEEPARYNCAALAEAEGGTLSAEVQGRLRAIRVALETVRPEGRDATRRCLAVRVLSWMRSDRSRESLARIAALPIETPEVRLARDATGRK